jgi:hypothetical protein
MDLLAQQLVRACEHSPCPLDGEVEPSDFALMLRALTLEPSLRCVAQPAAHLLDGDRRALGLVPTERFAEGALLLVGLSKGRHHVSERLVRVGLPECSLGGVGNLHGLASQGLGLIRLIPPCQYPGSRGPPRDLRGEVVRCSDLSAPLGGRVGFLVPAQLVQGTGVTRQDRAPGVVLEPDLFERREESLRRETGAQAIRRNRERVASRIPCPITAIANATAPPIRTPATASDSQCAPR